MSPNHDQNIRLKAFDLLKNLKEIHGDNIPRALLEKGFVFGDRKVPLIGPQGIFKPAVLDEIPLSITTTPEKKNKPRPYEDTNSDGLIGYKYREEGGPDHRENVGLRKAMLQKTPLVYFRGVAEGIYAAVWPVFIVGDDRKLETFSVAVDIPNKIYSDDNEPMVAKESRRRYQTVETQIRLHQAGFRFKVLKAYKESCAICHLKQPKLLEAAHILPDGHPKGDPIVQNGISLCMIHHGAYDNNIIGITPDYSVELNHEVLKEKDGPMLLHGLQEFHEKKLILPTSKRDWPKKEFLEERYQEFKAG